MDIDHALMMCLARSACDLVVFKSGAGQIRKVYLAWTARSHDPTGMVLALLGFASFQAIVYCLVIYVVFTVVVFIKAKII